jgi:hypothetical protein
MQKLENTLNNIFVTKAPKLPEEGKKALVRYLPWINLVLGLLTVWSAWTLWHWAHVADKLLGSINALNNLYGTPVVTTNRLSFGIWLGIIVLVIEAVLYLLAFPATRERKKSGWNLLFYAVLVNIVYAILVFFTSYGGFGSLLGGLVGSAIGLYFLFQIRSAYTHRKV